MSIEKVVNEHEVELWTRKGWAVIERYEIQEPKAVVKTYPQPGVNYPFVSNEMELARTARFRLRLDDETALAELQKEHETLKIDLAACRDVMKKNDEVLKKSTEMLKRAEEGLMHAQDQLKTVREHRDTAEKSKRALEEDIGKLRAHFGKKAVEEALGPRP